MLKKNSKNVKQSGKAVTIEAETIEFYRVLSMPIEVGSNITKNNIIGLLSSLIEAYQGKAKKPKSSHIESYQGLSRSIEAH